ncbi:MAG TPA: glutamate-cysteine ligase family protein [Saprospiraceae bacterium]|nr:glutamate-cysteine ligase family protein [Saprospiraceae bacterium]
MGEHKVRHVQHFEDRARFMPRLIEDVATLEAMLQESAFEQKIQRIGAEQELALLNPDCDPAFLGPQILETMTDPHFTTEIGRFNLEINLDPFPLSPDCLGFMQQHLVELLRTGRETARALDARILLCGIMPTLTYQHLQRDAMTPNPRYYALSDAIHAMRGRDFEVFLTGVDDMITAMDSLVFESCNTSFQTHLQIPTEEFTERYNWAQMISGPMLAVCANSPLLFGRELWSETRIALFQQAVETRTSANQLRNQQPRVFFGNRWIQHSIAELFKDNIARFPVILTKEVPDSSMAQFLSGQVPSLAALRLHNSTVYNWNRPCYGILDGQAHLRIECRYIPSGPTALDEMANFALWLGLMQGMPEKYKGFHQRVSFRSAKDNFMRAARIGINAMMDWFGEAVSPTRLFEKELLPAAREGLSRSGINDQDADCLLGVVAQRIHKRQTGARWQIRNFRKLQDRFGSAVALTELTKMMYEHQQTEQPAHEWPDMEWGSTYIFDCERCPVGKMMITDVYTVQEEEPLCLVKSIMEWKNIRHLPVENAEGDLTGLVTATNLSEFENSGEGWEQQPIKNFMVRELLTVAEDAPLDTMKDLMIQHGVGSVLVVHGRKLTGIVTKTDVEMWEKLRKR